MDKFAQLPNQERHDILQEAASQRGMTDIILEKDLGLLDTKTTFCIACFISLSDI